MGRVQRAVQEDRQGLSLGDRGAAKELGCQAAEESVMFKSRLGNATRTSEPRQTAAHFYLGVSTRRNYESL